MKAEILRITPAIASKWLASTTFRNRDASRSVVRRYASEMSSGRWALNGESIVLDDNGNVIDGQHRLMAVVQSGVSIDAVVVRGADQSVFTTFDTGIKRSGADALSSAGYPYAKALASILKNIATVRDRGFYDAMRSSHGKAVIRVADFLQMAKDHPGAVDSAAFVFKHTRTCEALRPPSFSGCMHYEFGCQDTEARDAFFSAIVNRTPYYTDSCPSVRLLKKYATISVQKEMRLSFRYRHEVWISCWEPFLKRFRPVESRSSARRPSDDRRKYSQSVFV